MGSIIQFTPAMRAAVAALLALCVAGLAWRAVSLYQADQRALKAAAFLEELESQSGGSAAGSAGWQQGGPPAASESATPSAAPHMLVVHVEGAVQRPDVYKLPEGSRVNDAILAAGGPLPDAVPGVLNLAAPLVDGAKVYVYRQSELEPAAPEPPRARGATYQPVKTTLDGSGTATGGHVLVNINTATQAELESVPGIGPAIARAIIAYRTEHGPFGQVDDLINVSGIGQKTLEKIRPYVTH